jgi:hypothetical protein
MKQIDVKRSTVILDPDRTHMMARPFSIMSDQRSVKISARVMALPENAVHALLEKGASCITGNSSFPTGYPITPQRSPHEGGIRT